jgi:hypothetical protein
MLASRVDKLRNYADRKSLELTVACGPFTASDGLFYKTLDALIEVLTEEPPDILMLVNKLTPSCVLAAKSFRSARLSI